MKRLVQNQLYNSIHESDYQGWEDDEGYSFGFRNTGHNLGGKQLPPCNYYIIANDNMLEGI